MQALPFYDNNILTAGNKIVTAGSEIYQPDLLVRPSLWGYSDGTVLETLTDSSLKGNHPTQPVAARRGTFKVDSATGIKYFKLDGVDDFYRLNLVNAATVFVVVRAEHMPEARIDPLFGNGSGGWNDGSVGWQWMGNSGSNNSWVMVYNGSVTPSGNAASNYSKGNRMYINNSGALNPLITIKSKKWTLLTMDIPTGEELVYPTGITHIGYDSSGGSSDGGVMGNPTRDAFAKYSYAHIEVYAKRLPLTELFQRRTQILTEFNLIT